MKVLYHLKDIDRNVNSVITVGTFDGIHLAHQNVISEVAKHAHSRQGKGVIVTFEPHPQEVIRNRSDAVRLLTTLDERIELFQVSAIDLVVVLEFTDEFAKLTAAEFLKNIIVDKIGLSEIVVGYDHAFGRDRAGNLRLIREIGSQYGFEVTLVPPYSLNGTVVSSTKIRRALSEGSVDFAGNMLGRPYLLTGRVVHGDGRGKILGFPTANIEPASMKKLVPKNGVYFVSLSVLGKEYYGMCNIGTRPTFRTDHQLAIEVHIFDVTMDLYEQVVELRFHKRIRDENKFASIGKMKDQLGEDKKTCLRILEDSSSRVH
jgi:riboflavin kinase/FMN adenylyltransferase